MARPKNKTELLDQSMVNYEKLMSFIDGLTPEKQEAEFPEGYLNQNIRDVLAHLHHWHLMFMEWYKVGMKGEKPEMPAKGYTWKTTPDLNVMIQKKYASTPLSEIRKLIKESFQSVRKTIDSHTDEELFEKKRYKWTGSTSLGSYTISATSSHYDWALKLIKKCIS